MLVRTVRQPGQPGPRGYQPKYRASSATRRKCTREKSVSPIASCAGEWHASTKSSTLSRGRELRKQYYFRPSRTGYFAWDIDRLIALTKNFEHEQIALDSIRELDENFWFAGENDNPTCRAIVEHMRLIGNADLRSPIILSADGRIMDGMHRVAKALLRNQESIVAVRFAEDPQPDYEDVQPDDLPY